MNLDPDPPPLPGHGAASSLDSEARRMSARCHPVIRLVALATTLACALLLGFSAWFIWSARQTQIAQADVAITNVARMVGAQVESAMKAATIALTDVTERARYDLAQPDARARLEAHLAELARTTPELHGLFVYGADGAWLATSLDRQVDGNNFDRAYFQYHLAHPGSAIHVGVPVKSRSTGVWIIPVSRSIQGADGKFAGVALVTLKINFFERIYDELDIGRTGTVLLMLSDGTVVYRRPFDEKLIGTDLSKGNIYKELQKTRAGSAFLHAKVDKVVRLYSFRHLDNFPFLVAVGRTRDELLGSWQRSSMLIAAAALLIGAVFILFANRLVRQIRIQDSLDHKVRMYSEELERRNLGLRVLAHTDKLTQLANRRRFDELLELELKRAQRGRAPLSLLLMDLDYFKQFNDSYGHLAGDACLQKAASVLAEGAARAGDLAARYGGEEFAVIMPDTDGAGAVAVAERVRACILALQIPHQHSPTQTVTASFGVATLVPDGVITVADIIACADRHLYAAKQNGRNRVCAGVHDGATLP
ncbi:MAG TPA: sensor domain-containing diguanylate cyclase [Pseudoduganella sp.]